jgi:hypothetical protein
VVPRARHRHLDAVMGGYVVVGTAGDELEVATDAGGDARGEYRP